MSGIRVREWLTPEEQRAVESETMDFDDAYSLAWQRKSDKEFFNELKWILLAASVGVIVGVLGNL